MHSRNCVKLGKEINLGLIHRMIVRSTHAVLIPRSATWRASRGMDRARSWFETPRCARLLTMRERPVHEV